MPGGDTEVTILGGDTHDENVSIDMNVTTSDHVSMSWTDEVPTGDMNTNAIVSIPTLERTIAEFNKAYEAELQQQIESIKQEMADLQNTWELVDDAMKTIQINIESCNDLLNYLKYISEALGQLKNIKTLHEQEQLQEEQEQSIHDLTGTFKSKFLRELENPVNAQEVLDALMNSVSALEKLLTISEAESLKSVLDSGKSVSAKLAQIPELGMSVTKILTQAMTSTSNISVTEILEAQIAALKHGELHSLLSDFIEKLRTITDGKAAFTDFIESQIRKSELILDDLTTELTDFQEYSIISTSTKLSDVLLKLERDLINLKEQLKEANRLKIKTEYDLDNLRFDLDKQHSTVNSLTSEISRLAESKRQAKKELEKLKDSQVPSSSPVTPSKRAVEIAAPETDLYTEEQFAKYDKGIKQLPDANKLMQEFHSFTTTTEIDKQTAQRILDFYEIAKNSAAIRQLLEKYNNYEIKIREARLTIAALEKEKTAREEEAKLATAQAAELDKQARLDEARQQEEARIREAIIKIEKGKATRTKESTRLSTERSKTDEIIAEQLARKLEKARLTAREATMLREEVTRLEKKAQATRLKEERLEGGCDEINKELWDLFSAKNESIRFIEQRISYSSNSNNPYELDQNLAIHSQALLQIGILTKPLEEERQRVAREKAERQREEAEMQRQLEEAERQRQLEAERQRQLEAERQRQLEAERQRQLEEAERLRAVVVPQRAVIAPVIPAAVFPLVAAVPVGPPAVPVPAPVVIIPPAAAVPAGPLAGPAVPLPAAVPQLLAPPVVPQAVPATPIPKTAEAIVDDWIIVDAEVPVEEEVTIVPKAAMIEMLVATTQKAAVQTKNEKKLEVLPPILKIDNPKVENLSIRYEFSPLTNEIRNATDEVNPNSDEIAALLLSRFNPIIVDKTVSDLIPDEFRLTPYYNTLMLQDRRRPDKRRLPQEIDRLGYSGDIRVC